MAMNRPEYRDAKTPRAVTVYTIAQESRHVVFKNVPALSGKETIIQDLLNKCSVYGTVEAWHQMEKQQQQHGQSSEESFTLAPILMTFATIDQARWIKHKMDDQVFYANLLQVSYAPEYDTVEDIRTKLEDRRTKVYARLRHVSYDDIAGNASDNKKTTRKRISKQHLWHRQRDSNENKQLRQFERSAVLIEQEPQHSTVAQGSKNEFIKESTDDTTTTTSTTMEQTTTKVSIDRISPHTLGHPKADTLATASFISNAAPAAKRRRI